ncbi:hypothetical protein Tco_1462022 [Tanacetum coccineum]
MLHGLVINWSSSAIETSRNRVNVFSFITVSFMRILGLREVARTTARIALEFAPEVDVRTYLMGGAMDGSEANGIIRHPKLELESSRFTFDLVPLSLMQS